MSEIEFERAVLVGYANPSGVRPCFAIPIFKPSLIANTHAAQIVGSNGLVLGFRQINIGNSDVVQTDTIEVSVNEKPICIFIDGDGQKDVRRLDDLQKALLHRTPTLGLSPFMALEVAEFGGAAPKIISEARLEAYQELRKRSPGSANFWRNALVFLPQVREAIRALLFGLNADKDSTEIESIGFQLTGSDATIKIPTSIHSLLTEQLGNWKAEVEKAISLDAETFGIKRIAFAEHIPDTRIQPIQNAARTLLLRTLVIAVGASSHRCAQHLLDKHARPEKPHSFSDAAYSLDQAIFSTNVPFVGLLRTEQIEGLDDYVTSISEDHPLSKGTPRPTGYENLKFIAILFDWDLKSIRSAQTIAQHYSSLGCTVVGVPTEGRLVIERSLRETHSNYSELAFDFIFDISNAFAPKRGQNKSPSHLIEEKVRECVSITHTIPSTWEDERKKASEIEPTWLVVSSSNRKSFRERFVDAHKGLLSESFLPLKAAGLLIITREMSEVVSAINLASNLSRITPDKILASTRNDRSSPLLTLLAKDSSDNSTKHKQGLIFESFCETLLKDHDWLVSQPDHKASYDFVARQNDLTCFIKCTIRPDALIKRYSQAAEKPATVVLTAMSPNTKDAWLLWLRGIRTLHYSNIEDLPDIAEFVPAVPIDALLGENENVLRRIIWSTAAPLIIRQIIDSGTLAPLSPDEDIRLSRPRFRKNFVDKRIEIIGDIELLKDGGRGRFTSIVDRTGLHLSKKDMATKTTG